MSDQGGLPQGSDPPLKPSPPVQTAAAPATFSKFLVNNAPPSVWHDLPLETNKPANSPELGENWSPLSERTDGNTIFCGNSSNDCWSGSRELRNSHPNVLGADWELHDIGSFFHDIKSLFSSLPGHSTMDLEKEAAERRYTDEKGKNVCDEPLRIDAKTKLSRPGRKFENINGGKLIIPNARVEKLINECSEKSTNSPTNKIDGDEIISSATNGPEIISEEMASAPAHKNERDSQMPEIGMEFASEKDAHKFYENYAKICGFKIRKGKVDWSSDGSVKKRTLLCSREGFRLKKSPNTSAKYARKETRTGCNARIKIIAQNGKWVISDLCLQHSHGQEALTQMHQGESSASVSKVKSLPQFVTVAEILEPAACSDKCSNDDFFGNINGFIEKEKEDDLSVSSATTKVQWCSNIPQTPENDKDLGSKSGCCQTDDRLGEMVLQSSFVHTDSGLKHIQNRSVLDLENSSGQVKSSVDNITLSLKEVQASSINIDDESMEKFYTNLDSADQDHSGPHVNTHSQGKELRELEIYEAIGLLRTLFKDKLSVVIRSKYLLALRSALSFLSSFTKEGDFSISLKSVFLKLAGVIPSIIHRYNRTNIVIDQIEKVKAAIDSINCKLMENKRMYLELSSTRTDITCEIDQIEKRVSFYLQQFNELKAKAEKQMELRDEVCKKIQSTYAEGTSLKRKADELDRKVEAMELEKVCAEQTRLELEDEWDKLGKLLEQNFGT